MFDDDFDDGIEPDEAELEGDDTDEPWADDSSWDDFDNDPEFDAEDDEELGAVEGFGDPEDDDWG